MSDDRKTDVRTRERTSPTAFCAEVERLLSLHPEVFAALGLTDLNPIIATIRATSSNVSSS